MEWCRAGAAAGSYRSRRTGQGPRLGHARAVQGRGQARPPRCCGYRQHHARCTCPESSGPLLPPAGDGKMQDCLEDHRQEEDFSERCRQALEARMVRESSDYELNYGLR